jgi:hypothetical protein
MLHKKFENAKIRHQVFEFLITNLEQVPSIYKKQQPGFLDEFLQLIFKMMIDIDIQIDQTFLQP